MIVEGQVHGGVAQGIGQALLEQVIYDDDGQLLTGSYMDYTMPRAADLPFYDVSHHSTPARIICLVLRAVEKRATSARSRR